MRKKDSFDRAMDFIFGTWIIVIVLNLALWGAGFWIVIKVLQNLRVI